MATPGSMPLVRAGRPLKRWVWIGAFAPEAIVCAARVWVAGVPTAWWCVVDRRTGAVAEGRRGVAVSAGTLRVQGRAELALGDGERVEVVAPAGRADTWTRKGGGVAARGWVLLGGERRPVDARAIVDESAGHHPRRTSWRWAAGVGTAASGASVAWNLIAGLHDAPGASERAVWVDGEPREVGPVTFGDDLGWAAGSGWMAYEPWRIECAPEHDLRLRRNLVVVRSDLRQRLGAVTGSLPFAGELREAWGVMESHDARW